jgi:transcriptional regulator with XRE-family HTH domain
VDARKILSVEKVFLGDTFQAFLQGQIRARGWNQSEAASALDISQSQLSFYLSGERKPSFETARKIAAALNVSIEQMNEAAPRTKRAVVVREERAVYAAEAAAVTEVLGRLKRRWKSGKDRQILELAVRVAFDDDAGFVIAWFDEE